jgi:hypothetical protein
VAIKAYNSPGVTVSETVNPALAPVTASPSLVAVVGAASGSVSASERLVLSSTTPVQLAHTGVSIPSVIVKLASTGETLNAGNYAVVQSGDPDTTVTGDELYTIARFGSPGSAPTAAPSGTGTLTGTYEYAFSYVNANGETGLSPTTGPVVITAAGYNLSNITVGPTGTLSRKIYRKKTLGTNADSTWHLVATIADNVTLVLTNETTSDVTANGNSQPVTGIASGDTVVVNYTYTDQNYFEPTLFDDYSDVIAKYGPPVDTNGLISSKLSYAIRLAFLNGASEVVGVAASADTQTPLESALAQLEDEHAVNIVVVANGATFAPSSLYAHLVKMNAQGYYRIGIAGRDGSTSLPLATTIRAAAQALNEESLRYVNVSSLQVTNSVTGSQLNIGGQFLAAAVAGMTAARDVQVPLTRKTVAGFEGINDKRTDSEKALDSAAGLLVVEDRGGVLRIRHDITTAVGDVNKRESSVVRAKYELAQRVRDALDTSVVGSVLPLDRGPTLVETVVRSVLESMIVEEAIAAYTDVKGRLLSGDPTTVEVRFSYTPAYPINNIAVVFQINTTTGDATFDTNTTG